MDCLLFTKLLKGLTLEQVGDVTRDLGFDGIDLLVRPGHQLTPAAPEQIVPAVARLRRMQLTVPAITTDIVDGSPTAQAIFEACARADVRLVRLGFWKYTGAPYRTLLDGARRDLDRIEALARRHAVRAMLQLHGGTIHDSAGLAVAMLDGHDPAYLGAYVDPGNQAVQDGREDWRLTFDILEPWLCFVGVKNGGWSLGPANANGQRQWTSDWMGISDGMVPWDDVLDWLVAHHSEVPLSLHSHYVEPLSLAIEHTRGDLRYVRGIVDASGAAAAVNGMPQHR